MDRILQYYIVLCVVVVVTFLAFLLDSSLDIAIIEPLTYLHFVDYEVRAQLSFPLLFVQVPIISLLDILIFVPLVLVSIRIFQQSDLPYEKMVRFLAVPLAYIGFSPIFLLIIIYIYQSGAQIVWLSDIRFYVNLGHAFFLVGLLFSILVAILLAISLPSYRRQYSLLIASLLVMLVLPEVLRRMIVVPQIFDVAEPDFFNSLSSVVFVGVNVYIVILLRSIFNKIQSTEKAANLTYPSAENGE